MTPEEQLSLLGAQFVSIHDQDGDPVTWAEMSDSIGRWYTFAHGVPRLRKNFHHWGGSKPALWIQLVGCGIVLYRDGTWACEETGG